MFVLWQIGSASLDETHKRVRMRPKEIKILLRNQVTLKSQMLEKQKSCVGSCRLCNMYNICRLFQESSATSSNK